jgi:hypothetical protein
MLGSGWIDPLVSGQLHTLAASPAGKNRRLGWPNVERKKIYTCQGSDSDPSVIQPVSIHCTDFVVRKCISRILSDKGTSAVPADANVVMLQQLKGKFDVTVDRHITILTFLPKNWSIMKT